MIQLVQSQCALRLGIPMNSELQHKWRGLILQEQKGGHVQLQDAGIRLLWNAQIQYADLPLYRTTDLAAKAFSFAQSTYTYTTIHS